MDRVWGRAQNWKLFWDSTGQRNQQDSQCEALGMHIESIMQEKECKMSINMQIVKASEKLKNLLTGILTMNQWLGNMPDTEKLKKYSACKY